MGRDKGDPMSKTGAELLIESLIAAGSKHLFTLSGNQILSLYDASIGRDIDLIHTRHEAAAVHMADGWGRLIEQPGVALLTAGPGHCNAISALYGALMAESPVVLLSGHSPYAQIGSGAFQEVDQVAAAKPVTKAAWLVEDPNHLDEAIATAFSLACEGRPGPVHLSLPVDVLETTVAPQSPQRMSKIDTSTDDTLTTDVDDILRRLTESKYPLILVGPAMGRPLRWVEVERLSETTGIPALPMKSPRGVNDPWLHQATNCLSKADLVLLLGKKLDFSLRFGQSPFFAEGCRFIQIDADSAQLRTENPAVLTIQAEPINVVRQLTAATQTLESLQQERRHNPWRTEVRAAREATLPEWGSLRESAGQPIHPLRVCEEIQPFIDDNAVFVSDGGEFGQWVQAGLEAKYRLINGPAGSIGSAIPMGLAAKLAYPQRPVFVFLGDGTFGYHAMEFDTALRYHLPIIAIVGNDARWNAEHQLQIQNYGPERTIGCELLPSRYDKMIGALGGYGEFVQQPTDLTPAVERALASGLPACINIGIESVSAPTFRSSRSLAH